MRISALQIRKKLHDVAADEVEVKFGLKATSEAGGNMFAVGKVGVEANYEVTLKWKKEPLPADVEARLQVLKSKKQQNKKLRRESCCRCAVSSRNRIAPTTACRLRDLTASPNNPKMCSR